MGDSNANTINQHLHNKPTTTYRLVTTFNLDQLNQQIQDYKDEINEYDQILILIGTNHLKLGQHANDIHRDITAITQPLDQNKLLIIEPPKTLIVETIPTSAQEHFRRFNWTRIPNFGKRSQSMTMSAILFFNFMRGKTNSLYLFWQCK